MQAQTSRHSCVIAAFIAFLVLAAPTGAANRLWVGPDGGLFLTSGNWSPAGMPVGFDVATFDDAAASDEVVVFVADRTHDRLVVQNGSYLLALGGNTYELTRAAGSTGIFVAAAPAASGGLRLNNGRLLCGDAVVGSAVGSSGQVWLQAGTVWTLSGKMFLGTGGQGTVTVMGGGQFDTVDASLGTQGSGDGGIDVLNLGSNVQVSGALVVGEVGAGSITVTDGATLVSAGAELAQDMSATGDITIADAGSSWTSNGTVTVGNAGDGGLVVDDTAQVFVTANLSIARTAGSIGDVDVGADALLDIASTLLVGDGGDGSLVIHNAGDVTSGNVRIGNAAGTTGQVTIDGLGCTLTSTGIVDVGLLGQGTVTLDHGGQLHATTVRVSPTGRLEGNGRVFAPVVSDGVVSPGLSAGAIVVQIDDYTQSGVGLLDIEIGGTAPGTFDVLAVGGTAQLAGAMQATLIDGFVPTGGDSFEVLTAAPVSGTFDLVTLPPLPLDRAWGIDYDSVAVVLETHAGPFAYRVSQWDPIGGSFVDLGFVTPYETGLPLVDYYSYGAPNSFQANFPPGEAPTPVNDESQLFLTHSAVDGLAMVFQHDRSVTPLGGVGGGRAEMRFQFFDDPDGESWIVVDEDTVTGDFGDTVFTSATVWSGAADGGILGKLDTDVWAAEASFSNVANPSGNEFNGLTAWRTYSADGTSIPLVLELDRPVRFEVAATCLEDCAQPRDGNVDIGDLLKILADWGTAGGCDTDGSGVTDIGDLLAVLARWGSCL